MALVLPSGEALDGYGEVEGVIAGEERGQSGFGYDPIFWYPPAGRTFGEMTAEEKHGIPANGSAALSHRARAFQILARACL